MNSKRFLSIAIFHFLIFYAFLLEAQTIGFSLKDGQKKVVIPFESYNNLIIVPVVLNNSYPLRFILDTGVQTTILTERTFSDLLDIQYHRKLTLYGADGDRGVEAYVAANVSLELPGTTGEGQVMLVLEEDYLQLKHYLGEEVHGILGYEIFRRFIVKIDYDARELTLYEPSFFKPPKSYEEIPIEVEITKPYFNADITFSNGTKVPVKLMLDTGASHSLLIDESSHEAIELPEKRIEGVLGRGLGGDITGYIGRIENINISKFQLTEVIASFPDTSRVGDIFKKTGRNGTLGAGILRRFTTIVDYYNNKLYLKKNRFFKTPFEFNMSGMDIMAEGQNLNVFIVHEIKEGGPSDRVGVRVGDTIKVINGMRARSLDLNDINSLFRRRDGKKIKLKIERDNNTIKKVFRLEKVI